VRAPQRDAAAGHQHGHRALARADGTHVAHGERAAAPQELGGREHARDLPPEVREVFQRRAKAVDRVRVYRAECRRV